MNSNNSIISLEDISKTYRIYPSPAHRVYEAINPFGRQFHEPFFALKNISLEIKRGESIGIVGKNGSGKSTLLKIISGVLQPSDGLLTVNGKVSALLELGAGFNPEFTGIENVYFNGSIMGYSKEQVEERLDSILSFADIGAFINQPVKTYSSGMFVRLAFSLATSIDPDILIVDEALSVGDMFFQAKCALRMKKMIDNGATVLFVSHDLGSIKSLTKRGLLLENGRLTLDDNIAKVAEKYFNSASNSSSGEEIKRHDSALEGSSFEKTKDYMRISNGKIEVTDVAILNHQEQPTINFDFNEECNFHIKIECNEDSENLTYGYHLRDQHGVDVLYSDSLIMESPLPKMKKGDTYLIKISIRLPIISGNYSLSIVVSKPVDIRAGAVEFFDFIPIAGQLTVAPRKPSPIYGKVNVPAIVTIQKNKIT